MISRSLNDHDNSVFYWNNGIILSCSSCYYNYDNHQYILNNDVDLHIKKNLPYKIDVIIA